MQNSITFCLFILKFTSKVDGYYKKNQYFFSLYTNFEIFQKFSVKIKIFLHILIVLIMYESGKVKKIQSNKIGITIYSWTVCLFCLDFSFSIFSPFFSYFFYQSFFFFITVKFWLSPRKNLTKKLYNHYILSLCNLGIYKGREPSHLIHTESLKCFKVHHILHTWDIVSKGRFLWKFLLSLI